MKYISLFILLVSLNTYSIKRAETYQNSIFKLRGAFPVTRGRLKGLAVTSGTGFSVRINQKNYILSNSHVCRNFTHMLAYNKFGTFFVKVLKKVNKPDLCILEGVRFIKPIPFAKKIPKINSKVISIGHPKGGPINISWGRYIRKKEIIMKALVRIDCDIYNGTYCYWKFKTLESNVYTVGGSSGSPLLNKKGKVIGVIFAGDSRNNYGYAIPLSDTIKFLKNFKNLENANNGSTKSTN